jgi:hypothetical protein
MAYYSGKGGSLQVDASTIGRVANWSFSTNTELADVSKLGDCDRSFEPTARTSTGTAAIWYTDEANAAGSVLSKIIQTGSAHVAPRVRMTLQFGISKEKRLEFYAYLTSATLACGFGEVMQAQVNFQMDGGFIAVAL